MILPLTLQNPRIMLPQIKFIRSIENSCFHSIYFRFIDFDRYLLEPKDKIPINNIYSFFRKFTFPYYISIYLRLINLPVTFGGTNNKIAINNKCHDYL